MKTEPHGINPDVPPNGQGCAALASGLLARRKLHEALKVVANGLLRKHYVESVNYESLAMYPTKCGSDLFNP